MQHVKRFSEGRLDDSLILKELKLSRGQTVVDGGCGSGYMSRLMARSVGPEGRVYALDVNAHYVDSLRREATEDNLEALVCDMTSTMPLTDGEADRVFISTVIHSLRREWMPGLIAELRRVLRPGGLLGVVEMAKVDTPFGPPLWQRYSPEELCAALPFEPVKTVMVAEFFYMQLFLARGEG
ncbi:methyltransferase domain-containing protein [Pseudodesulfovibrio cashew]|uniref:Methyltransferase domain-containing protein n=1 Tax=Pseudodesulfovibrio cashew TaxID=2678688 RepID=A0A6I6JJ24_9BACT|nr:class I SAM-dependent methyltransferase [Pseudodesulfovibrio cashew]QGY41070.1 methyltransferase domain-containing protein [Pseudodesulfovibrio cashew]